MVNLYLDINKGSKIQIEDKDSSDLKLEYGLSKDNFGKDRIYITEESKENEQVSARTEISDNTIQFKDNKF